MKAKATPEVLTDAEMKREYRRLSKLWHPDVWDIGLPERTDSVAQVISRLFQEMKEEGLTNFDVWPSKFEDGYKVTFPAFSDEELVQITSGEHERHSAYLPKTPKDFISLLNYIEHNHSFPQKQFPAVRLSRASRGDIFAEGHGGEPGFMDQEFSEEFGRFKTALVQADSIERLIGMMGAIDVLPPGTAETHKLYDIIDGQAEYLFSGLIIQAESEQEFEEVSTKIDAFPFGQKEIATRLKLVLVRSLQNHFKQQITRSGSTAGLEKIAKKIARVSANIPDSKSACDELLLLIEKKASSYATIWATRRASRGLDK